MSDLTGEVADLRATGDLMQSEASRVAEWIDDARRLHPTTLEMPYEVQMAALGLGGAIEEWTRIRVAHTIASSGDQREDTDG